MKKATLSAALKSGKGNVRTNNEDAYFFNGDFAALKDMDQETSLECACSEETALFAICDGMGGYENGEVASYTTVSRIPKLKSALKLFDFSTAITRWVEETNAAVNDATRDGGCTLALLYYQSENVHIAHIGDSRIYRFHQGKLVRMTKDHSRMQVLLDAGIITEKEAETYPQRHVITRALGMDEEENGKCMPTVHEPVPVEDQDRYIICSDGVTDMLSDDRIENLLSHSQTVFECADSVYRAALDAGGRDNTSVIAIEFKCDQTQETSGNAESKDAFESTWTPEQEASCPISIEQHTTIKQENGRNITIKTIISGSPINGLFFMR